MLNKIIFKAKVVFMFIKINLNAQNKPTLLQDHINVYTNVDKLTFDSLLNYKIYWLRSEDDSLNDLNIFVFKNNKRPLRYLSKNKYIEIETNEWKNYLIRLEKKHYFDISIFDLKSIIFWSCSYSYGKRTRDCDLN